MKKDYSWLKLNAGYLVCVLLVLLTSTFIRSDYLLGLLVTMGVLAISATGMVLMFGLAHQLVLGQAAFCLVGAYGTGLLTSRHGWDPLLALVVSACVSMAFAWLIGKPILRLRGFVLAMASLAVQLILIQIATESMSLTGGSMGLTGVPAFSALGLRLTSVQAMVYVTWLTVILAVYVCKNISRSRIGRGLRAIASSEAGAASVGINIADQKVQMFIVSAAMASVAGSLAAHYLRIVEPQIFNLQYGFAILTCVIIGGLLSPWGGVIGAVLITLLREGMRGIEMPLLETLIIGSATVLALILMPGGVAGMLANASRRTRPLPAGALPQEAVHGEAGIKSSTLASGKRHTGALLEVKNISVTFGKIKAVDDVTFNVPQGSITALIGPNGAGKTTTFNLVCGYMPCHSGTVVFDGEEIQQKSVDEIARLGIARTFQIIQLFKGMTVVENVMAGRQRFSKTSLAGVVAWTKAQRNEEADALRNALNCLRFVGLEHLANELPETLPFGQQRQVELARALATEPKLLVMDEPASGLNDVETEQLAQLIVRIKAAGVTVLLVEHDLRLVMGLSNHLVVMDRGRKLEEGSPEVVRNSKSVIDAYLVGVINDEAAPA